MKATKIPKLTSEESLLILSPKNILKPIITLSKHFSNSKFQNKLRL